MMNRVMLMGNVGQDPVVKQTVDGGTVATLSLATKMRDDTQWHRCVFFKKQAELVEQYVRKGKLIVVEGSIKYGKYTDKAGIERHTTEILCNNLIFVPQAKPEARQEERHDDEEVPF